MTRALVVSPQPFFSPRGTPFSVYYRTLILSELGVAVDLLTYGEGQDVEIPGVNIIRIPRFRYLGNVKTGPSMLKLFLDVCLFLRTFGRLCRHSYDFVHAHEESVFFCRYLKPIFRYKLVYDMHSSLPQQLENFDFTSSKTIKRIFAWQEDRAIAKSDAVITICPDLADYVDGLLEDRSKHVLIENSIFEPVRLVGTGSERPSSHDAPTVAAEVQRLSESHRIVGYAGTLEHYQGVEILVRSFPVVLDQCPDAYLLIMGGTPEQVEKYEGMVADLGLGDSCWLTGRLPQDQVTRSLEYASVLVSPRTEGTNTPLKIYQQLASGKPLVATNIYSHTQVLSDDVAVLVDPEPAAMARGISDALTDRKIAATVSENARDLYERKYSRDSYVAKMRKLLAILD